MTINLKLEEKEFNSLFEFIEYEYLDRNIVNIRYKMDKAKKDLEKVKQSKLI